MKSRITRALALGGAVAAMVALAAPASAAPEVHYGNCPIYGKWDSHPFKPAIPGQLTVETNLPSPGWWNGDSPATIKGGYEYCMAANIAYRAGLKKVKVVNVAWDALIAGQTRNFDLALAEISITPERAKVVDFSVPYFHSNIGVLVRKGEHVTGKNIRDMKIGVQQGTTGAIFVRDKLKPHKSLKVFPGQPGMFTALAAHQVQVAMTDTSIVLAQEKASGGRLKVVGQYDTGETYGALYPKHSPNEDVLNEIITSLIKDGSLGKLSAKYLAAAWGTDPNKVPYWPL